MIVPLRAARQSRPRLSLAASRSFFLLLLLVAFGTSACAQGLSPGGPVSFGSVPIGSSTTQTLTFFAPQAGVDIQSATAITEGALNKDFRVVSSTCNGMLHLPATCTIELSFAPTQIGTRLGALIITNTADVVINTVYLSGVGLGPQFVFAPTTAITTSSANISPASFTAGAGVLDGSGNLYFTDVANNRILERSSVGVYSVVPTSGLLTVTATSGITIDGVGTLYVSSGNLVYDFMPGSTPVPLVTPGVTLVTPTGLAIDTAGDLYIADSSSNKIYQVPLGDNTAAALAITGPGASLSGPTGLGVDSNNNLYIADTGNSRIVEVNLSSLTSFVVTLNSLTLTNPTGVSVDPAGTVYIANTGGSDIIESTATGAQFVLADPSLVLDTPSNIVIAGNGDLVLSDYSLGLIDVHRSSPAVVFPTPTVVGSLDVTDDPLDLTVQSSGNVVSELTVSSNGDPTISTSAFLLANSGTCPILGSGSTPSAADNFLVGQVCTYAIDFQPTVVGPNLANLVLTTSGSGQTTSNTVPLSGIGLPSIASFVLIASPNVTTIGTPVSLTLTADRSDGSTAIDYVGTVTFTDTDTTSKYLGGTGAGTGTTTYTFTAADDGVLIIPAPVGLQFNQLGTFTAFATDGTHSATSNPVRVVEPSTLSLTSSVNPSQVNQQTVFTLNVGSVGPAPTGTVTFYSNGVAIGTSNVTAGAASLTYAFTAVGTYAITAVYSGDTNTLGGSAGPLSQVVVNTTTMTLSSSVNPSLVNQNTTLTATIVALGSPTGTVKFYDGATLIGTVSVAGNAASLVVSFSTAGTHLLTAVYSGDIHTNPATAHLSQVVLNAAAITLTSSVNPSFINQSTTLTANLTALGSPTGTVRFYDGTTLLGTVTLAANSASLSVSFSTPGTHVLTAVYSGDTLTEPITSAPLNQIVLNNSTITLTSSVNPVYVNANTTLTASVHSAGTPTGTVTFYAGTTKLGTSTIAGDVASLVVSFPTAGIYTLTAVYAGDGNNAPATSAPLSQTVLNLITVSLTSSINPVLLDNPTVLTALLTSNGSAPTGTVSFLDGTTPIGTAAVVNGVASINATFLYAGTHSITAMYSGDTLSGAATSPALSQIVADFSFAVASGGSSSSSTLAGNTTSYALTLTPLITTTLPSAVTFTVTGLPTGSSSVFAPTTVAAGAGVTPIALSVTAAQITAALHRQPIPAHPSPVRYAPVALAFLALPFAWSRRRKRFGSLLASICLLLAVGGLSGCVSDPSTGYYGQTPKTYNLTVTATSGNLARSVYLTLTIQ